MGSRKGIYHYEELSEEEYLGMDIFAELQKLTDYERQFLLEYFKDQNASAAAQRCAKSGFQGSEKRKTRMMSYPAQSGYLTLNKPCVRRVATAYAKQKLLSMDASITRILQELSCVAFANISHYISWKKNSIVLDGSQEIPQDLLPAIKKITRRPTRNGVLVEIELHDKDKALEMLGRYHTMFKDKVTADVNMGGVLRVPSEMTPEQWQEQGEKKNG